jgi:hypothetical protein
LPGGILTHWESAALPRRTPLAVIRLPSICLVKNCPEKQTDIFLELLARLYLSITSNGVRAGLVPRRISTHFSTLLV